MQRDHTIDELEALEFRNHHRQERKLERLGWLGMAVTVGVALFGGLGPGWFSWKRIETPDGSLNIEYASVVHHEAPGEFVLRIRPKSSGSTVRLGISRSFCDHVTLDAIVPRPLEEQGRKSDVVYTFAVDPPEPSTVIFRFSYDDFGGFDHRLELEGGMPVEFHQRVLP